MRRIFGPKRDKVRGEWRRLHKEEHNDVYSSPNIRYSSVQIQWNEMGGACSMYGWRRSACRISVEEPEGIRQIGRLGRSYKYNIKTDLEDVG
jgi:hypothetical protein